MKNPRPLLHGTALALALWSSPTRASDTLDARVGAFVAETGAQKTDALRLIFIGDSGAEPLDRPALPDDEVITRAGREKLRASMLAEQADAIYVAGDLIYGPGPLELSPRCEDALQDAEVKALMDDRLGDYYQGLAPTVWLVLGNHDVGHIRYDRARARCLLSYADQHSTVALPASSYSVDHGLARVVVLDTNQDVDRWDVAQIVGARAEGAWNIQVGHHVLRTAFDKEGEQRDGRHAIRGWFAEHPEARPDLWVNGHAHFLQFGVYDQIPALTSAAGSKLRSRDACPGESCSFEDAPLFARSVFGYAVVDLSVDELVVRMKDEDGKTLWCWRRSRTEPGGELC